MRKPQHLYQVLAKDKPKPEISAISVQVFGNELRNNDFRQIMMPILYFCQQQKIRVCVHNLGSQNKKFQYWVKIMEQVFDLDLIIHQMSYADHFDKISFAKYFIGSLHEQLGLNDLCGSINHFLIK